jgi:hypothetical protein
MELSPTWEANNYSETNKFQNIIEPENLLPCSQEAAIGLYPKLRESTPHPLIPFI